MHPLWLAFEEIPEDTQMPLSSVPQPRIPFNHQQGGVSVAMTNQSQHRSVSEALPGSSASSTLVLSTEVEEVQTQLPSVDEFLALVERESREASQDVSGYSVYHKYNKSC